MNILRLRILVYLVLIQFFWQTGISAQAITDRGKGHWDLNASSGYYSGGPGDGADLFSTAIGYTFKDLLFISIGPALNKTSFYHATGTSLVDDEKFLRVGFNLNSTFKVPRKTRLYVQLDVNYCYSGTVSPYYHIESPSRQYFYITLNPDKLPVNYFYAGAGLGFRLLKK